MTTRRRQIFLALSTMVGVGAIVYGPDRTVVGNALIMAVAAISWLFCIVYAARSNWRSTDAGRSIMRLVACLGIICTQGTVTILTHFSYPAREYIRPVLLLVIFLALLDLFLTLLRNQGIKDKGVTS